ncbi:MAG: hypothetical protein ACOC92_00840 [bacterium]
MDDFKALIALLTVIAIALLPIWLRRGAVPRSSGRLRDRELVVVSRSPTMKSVLEKSICREVRACSFVDLAVLKAGAHRANRDKVLLLVDADSRRMAREVADFLEPAPTALVLASPWALGPRRRLRSKGIPVQLRGASVAAIRNKLESLAKDV